MNQMNDARAWAGQALAARDLVTPAYNFNLQVVINDIDAVRATIAKVCGQQVHPSVLGAFWAAMWA